jgi:hypothetical protein
MSESIAIHRCLNCGYEGKTREKHVTACYVTEKHGDMWEDAPRMPLPDYSDVWDLTGKEGGDHVLVALTIDECKALLAINTIFMGDSNHVNAAMTAIEQIRLALRDQKDIDA